MANQLEWNHPFGISSLWAVFWTRSCLIRSWNFFEFVYFLAVAEMDSQIVYSSTFLYEYFMRRSARVCNCIFYRWCLIFWKFEVFIFLLIFFCNMLFEIFDWFFEFVKFHQLNFLRIYFDIFLIFIIKNHFRWKNSWQGNLYFQEKKKKKKLDWKKIETTIIKFWEKCLFLNFLKILKSWMVLDYTKKNHLKKGGLDFVILIYFHHLVFNFLKIRDFYFLYIFPSDIFSEIFNFFWIHQIPWAWIFLNLFWYIFKS